MADDKGGGAWEWGPLEIILLVILIIAVVDRLSGRPPLFSEQNVSGPSSQQVLESQQEAMCGLALTSPKPLQKVTMNLLVSGEVTGCNWNPSGDTALYAQITDVRGRPLSEYQRIAAASPSDDGRASFSTTLYLTGPTKGTGYLILIPARQPDGASRSISARIPLTF